MNDNNTKITIEKDIDPINLEKTIIEESIKIGFDQEKQNDSLNAYLSYSYIHYFDAIHYTLNLFSLIVVKKDTKEVLASAFCTGDGPSGAKGIVSNTFAKLGDELKSIKIEDSKKK